TGAKEFTDAILCCVSSGPRGITLIPQLTWGLGQNALFVNLYTPGRMRCEFAGVPVEVTCETAFPADGRVLIRVNAERPVDFTLRLRVPEWTGGFELQSGADTLHGTPGKLLDVSRTWHGSSPLEIRMEMPTRAAPGSPSYPDYLMLLRGPQVLALEQSLNAEVPYLHRVAVAARPGTPRALVLTPGNGAPQGDEGDATGGLAGRDGPARFESRGRR